MSFDIKNLKVAVVGGGIGGAATAACFASKGAAVQLFERAPKLREVGAGIFLKENSLRVLRALGYESDIADMGTWITQAQLWGHNANAMLKRSIPSGNVIVVRREDIHSTLLKAASKFGAEIATDSSVSSADSNGILRMQDGRVLAFDLIVGADGVGSTVRNSLAIGRTVEDTGNGSWRALAQSNDHDPKNEVIEFWRGHRRVLVVPAGPGRTYICASSRDDDREASGERFDARIWARHFPEFADLIFRLDPVPMVRRQHVTVKVNKWFEGKVAILGDAVHGQPPNLGQGAGCAIANGFALAEIVSASDDLPTALSGWENQQRQLTEDVQSFSNTYDHIVHAWPTSIESAREAFVWSIGKFPPSRKRWARLSAGVMPA